MDQCTRQKQSGHAKEGSDSEGTHVSRLRRVIGVRHCHAKTSRREVERAMQARHGCMCSFHSTRRWFLVKLVFWESSAIFRSKLGTVTAFVHLASLLRSGNSGKNEAAY